LSSPQMAGQTEALLDSEWGVTMRRAISSMFRAGCVLGAAGVMLLLPAGRASATLLVGVEAAGAQADAVTSTDTAIHGFARTFTSPGGETTFAGPGPGPLCLFGPFPCEFLGADVARAAGQISATEGRFRVQALGPDGDADVLLRLDDMLVLTGGPVAFDIHLSAFLQDFGRLQFGVSLLGPEICGETCFNPPLPVFTFDLTVDSGSERVFIEQHIPLDFTNTPGLCLLRPDVCSGTLGASVPLVITLQADAGEGGRVLADDTGLIGIAGAQSTSGYSYPFRVDPTVSVPAPATAVLLVGGLALLWARARRK